MTTVQLRPNATMAQWRSVLWTQLNQRSPIVLNPGEAWYDEQGVVRFFSVKTPHVSGGIKNFKLLPRDQTRDWVLSITSDWLVDMGLELVGNAIYSGDRLIVNLAQALAQEYASVKIKDYIRNVRIANLAYFEVVTGTEWFGEPLQI